MGDIGDGQSPDRLGKEYGLDLAVTPPALPARWRAPFLLTPFGDRTPPIARYNQLALVDIQYDGTRPGYEAMICGLYMLEEMKYFRFGFFNSPSVTKWLWYQCDSPSGPRTGQNGPFLADLAVPARSFLEAGQYLGAWTAVRRKGYHFVVPTPPDGTVPPDKHTFGTWFMTDQFLTDQDVEAIPMRVVNIGGDNGLALPFLGAYFIALSPGPLPLDERLQEDINLAVEQKGEVSFDYDNPLRTQSDIQRALAKPLGACGCTLADIQKLIPGLEATPDWPLPEWSNQVHIKGATLGQSLVAYVTEVFYNDQLPLPEKPAEPGRQLSRFYYLTPAGWGDYRQRQDEILYWNFTHIAQYRYDGSAWQFYCSAAPPPGVGYPRRNFPARFGSTVKGCIRGNRDFNMKPDEAMYFIVSSPMLRPDDKASIFWWWFMQDQSGILFSECELAAAPMHALSLIDYATFERNATWIDESYFPDPVTDKSPMCSEIGAGQCPPNW